MDDGELRVFIYAALVGLVALGLFQVVTVSQISGEITAGAAVLKQKAVPAKIELILLTTDCGECFSVEIPIANLREADTINITSERSLAMGSAEALALIDNYGVRRLPAVIVNGQVERISLKDFQKRKDAWVFDNAPAPYVDAKTGLVKGLVSAIAIKDGACTLCPDLGFIVDDLKQQGIKFSEFTELESEAAQDLIASHNIAKIPSLLLSDDILEYAIAASIEQRGLRKEGNYYLIENPVPYVEVETGEIRGLVSIVLIDDSSCSDCYDVNVHKQILASFALAVENEKLLDIGSLEGKQFLAKYGITRVPTVVIQGDVSVYDSLTSVWSQVGTIEEDGSYVFRKLSVIGEGIKFTDLAG